MKIIDCLLLGAVVLIVLAAVRSCIVRRREGNTCDGCCSKCSHGCGK